MAILNTTQRARFDVNVNAPMVIDALNIELCADGTGKNLIAFEAAVDGVDVVKRVITNIGATGCVLYFMFTGARDEVGPMLTTGGLSPNIRAHGQLTVGQSIDLSWYRGQVNIIGITGGVIAFKASVLELTTNRYAS